MLGQEKDGGLDILWELPIGSIPHRPLISVQCKNGEFDLGQADQSVGAGSRFFNDYIFPSIVVSKPMNFVPLGLSDLARLETLVTVETI